MVLWRDNGYSGSIDVLKALACAWISVSLGLMDKETSLNARVYYGFYLHLGLQILILLLELFFFSNLNPPITQDERGLLECCQECDCFHQSSSAACVLPLSLDTDVAWLGFSATSSRFCHLSRSHCALL